MWMQHILAYLRFRRLDIDIITIYFYSEWFLQILQQVVILNYVFIVNFPVIVVVVYVATRFGE